MRLSDLLSIPYVLRAETIEPAAGKAHIRLTYRELHDCVAEGIVLEEVLAELDRKRMAIIVALVGRGEVPPMPRRALAAHDPLWIARDIDAAVCVISALEQD